MKQPQSPSVLNLPQYLAYARLDPDSVRFTDGRLTACYTAGNEIAYKVDWKERKCSLVEYFKGEELAYSRNYPDLRSAFLAYMRTLNLETNPNFQAIAEQLTGNFYFALPDPDSQQQSAFFFPAGYIFVLQIPLVDETLRLWHDLQNRTQGNDPGDLLFKFQNEWDGLILKYRSDNTIEYETVTLVDLSTTLLDVTKAVKVCNDNRLILPEKEHWLTIRDVANINRPGMMPLYKGDPDRGYISFSIMIAPAEGPDSVIPYFKDITEQIFGV